jgi:hypothetical protein
MASTKVIATTWAKKDLVKKLQETLKRMDDEIEAWSKAEQTLKQRQDAWDKKAIAWAKKNVAKAYKTDVSSYINSFDLAYSFDIKLASEALGERPSYSRQPEHKDAGRGEISDYEQVKNALALIEGSTDVEFKINTSTQWALFIR